MLSSRVSDEDLIAQAEDDQWTHFHTYDSTLNANLARAFLEAEGIPCFLENEYSAGMGMIAPTASLIVPLRLLVPASLLARARALSSAAMHDDAMAEEAYHPSDDS